MVTVKIHRIFFSVAGVVWRRFFAKCTHRQSVQTTPFQATGVPANRDSKTSVLPDSRPKFFLKEVFDLPTIKRAAPPSTRLSRIDILVSKARFLLKAKHPRTDSAYKCRAGLKRKPHGRCLHLANELSRVVCSYQF